MTGVEKADYSREEQVEYTDKAYIPKMIKELHKSREKAADRVGEYLRHYAEINAIRQDELNKRSFREYVRMIMQ